MPRDRESLEPIEIGKEDKQFVIYLGIIYFQIIIQYFLNTVSEIIIRDA